MAIVKTASSVGLLGSQCLLTGMQPHIAQTIVEQGIDLSAFKALPTVRQAVAMAMKRSA
jgi:rsbT co-antagonist protein RsbR